jgi:hypothetical protein
MSIYSSIILDIIRKQKKGVRRMRIKDHIDLTGGIKMRKVICERADGRRYTVRITKNAPLMCIVNALLDHGQAVINGDGTWTYKDCVGNIVTAKERRGN